MGCVVSSNEGTVCENKQAKNPTPAVLVKLDSVPEIPQEEIFRSERDKIVEDEKYKNLKIDLEQ